MNTTQVAIYARVSSEQQAETLHHCESGGRLVGAGGHEGLAVSEAMQFLDEGYSGATLVRPALEPARCGCVGQCGPALCALAGSLGPHICLSSAAGR